MSVYYLKTPIFVLFNYKWLETIEELLITLFSIFYKLPNII